MIPLSGSCVGQRVDVALGQVGVVGDPDRAVLEVVDGVLVAHRHVVDAAVQPDRRVRTAGRRRLRVVDVAVGVPVVRDLPRLHVGQVDGRAARSRPPGRPAARRGPRRARPATRPTDSTSRNGDRRTGRSSVSVSLTASGYGGGRSAAAPHPISERTSSTTADSAHSASTPRRNRSRGSRWLARLPSGIATASSGR